MNIYIATALTFAAALAWLRFMDFLAHRGWVESRLSRKIIHIGTGPIFVLCWLLFEDVPAARYFAALVPALITVQFALVGLGIVKDDTAVQAMSRSADRREILRGPLYYGIVFVVITIWFWKDSPIGIIALMLMCGGDGIADLIGRKVRSPKLPWNQDKSLAGSLGVLLGGFTLAVLTLSVFITVGIFGKHLTAYIPAILLISLTGTLVESLPYKDIDNITVTLAAVLAGLLIL